MKFEIAKNKFVHRFTCEHVPTWSEIPAPNGKFYAPQFRTDEEWYKNTIFPPNNPFNETDCYSKNRTWPYGKWLDKPFKK